MDKGADVPGSQGVAIILAYSERIAALTGNDVKPISLQRLGYVLGRHLFSFGARLPAFHHGSGNRGHMLLQGSDRLAVS